MQKSITLGNVTFRWNEDKLIITTSQGQHVLSPDEAVELLSFLYDDGMKDEIFRVQRGLPEWAQNHAALRRIVSIQEEK